MHHLSFSLFISTGTYEEAVKALKKCEDTSNLESEQEGFTGPLYTNLRRHPESRPRSNSSSSDSSVASEPKGPPHVPKSHALTLVKRKFSLGLN